MPKAVKDTYCFFCGRGRESLIEPWSYLGDDRWACDASECQKQFTERGWDDITGYQPISAKVARES